MQWRHTALWSPFWARRQNRGFAYPDLPLYRSPNQTQTYTQKRKQIRSGGLHYIQHVGHILESVEFRGLGSLSLPNLSISQKKTNSFVSAAHSILIT